MERLKIELDRGLLPAAVRGLAKCKGITYEEAHWDMTQWGKANPPPSEHRFQKGRATAQDAHETWKREQRRYGYHTPDDFEPNF